MKKYSILKFFPDSSTTNRERGATAVIVAITLAMLMGFTALAVDVGYIYATNNELQNVADAAALAAARQLGTIYQGMTYDEQQSYNVEAGGGRAAIVSAARDVALKNRAARLSIDVSDSDIIIGRWNPTSNSLTVTPSAPNAVRIIARRDSSINGPVATFFAKVLNLFGGNHDTVDISADATAALTGKSEALPGEVEVPIGISSYYFNNPESPEYCLNDIKFAPTNDPAACAGWNTFDSQPANDAKVRDIMEGLMTSPHTTISDSYEFTGGKLSDNTFKDFLTLFQHKGKDVLKADGSTTPLYELDNDGNTKIDNDGNPVRALYPDGEERNEHVWETAVVVYEMYDCSNPSGSLEIIGFSDVVIHTVLEAPEKTIIANVECNKFDDDATRGGGGAYGIMGSIPGLVE